MTKKKIGDRDSRDISSNSSIFENLVASFFWQMFNI